MLMPSLSSHCAYRDSPDPAYDFNKRLRRAYESVSYPFPLRRLGADQYCCAENAKITDPVAMKKQLELAEHIKKGEFVLRP